MATENLWMGSLESLHEITEMRKAAMSNADVAMFAPRESESENAVPSYDVHGKVAVVPIHGPIISRGNILTQLFDIADYQTIRNNIVSAASDPEVDHIVLSVDSPGGSALGVSDVGRLIRTVNDTVKPVTAFADGSMSSAAYWLGSSAGKVYASELSSVGSIGVVATHFDHTKELEQEGVKATVLRIGEYKALGGPYEVLDNKAQTSLLSEMSVMNDLFVDHVAAMRGVPSAVVRERMGEGRSFIGHQAVSAGLVDGIMTLDGLVGRLNRDVTTQEKSAMARRKLLDEKTVAALASGAAPEAVLNDAQDAQTEEVVVEEEVQEAVPEVPVEEAAPAVDASLVAHLQKELSERTNQLISAKAENMALQSKLDQFESTHSGMRSVVASSINRMRIALGGSSMDLDSLDDSVLLAEHSKATKDFVATYPVGGKAVLPSTEVEAKATPRAPLRAVKFK